MLTFNFNPFPVLETERLLLREITEADAETLFKLRTDMTVMKYIDRPIPNKIDDVLELIAKMKQIKENGEGISWGICWKNDPATQIGNIGFFRTQPENHRAEVGYLLEVASHRKGVMFEAMQKVLDYGFNTMKLHSIEANINPANQASQGILEKAGFVREAYFKENHYFNGTYVDTAIYSLINK